MSRMTHHLLYKAYIPHCTSHDARSSNIQDQGPACSSRDAEILFFRPIRSHSVARQSILMLSRGNLIHKRFRRQKPSPKALSLARAEHRLRVASCLVTVTKVMIRSNGLTFNKLNMPSPKAVFGIYRY